MKPRLMLLGLALLLVSFLAGCAHSDRGMVWTEEGLTAAESEWDRLYRDRAVLCESQHKPKTPEMEECFGEWYGADARVEQAVGVAVAALRAYWVARARQVDPAKPWIDVAAEIAGLVSDLPPPARKVFERVKGVK